jgi:transposase
MSAAAESTIGSLQTKLNACEQEILYLKEQNAWLLRQIFGKKSERVVDANPEQLKLDGFENISSEKGKTHTIPAHERRTKTRTGEDTIRLPDDLPVETIVIDLPEEEKICKETGLPLQKIGEEVSHKLAHRPGSFFLKRIVRPKYAHPTREEKGVVVASMPDTLLPKCRADDSLIAEIATRKFVDHLPLYRIAENFAREGIKISRRLLSQWVVAAGLALYPLYQAMKQKILAGDRLHIDESPVDLFDSPKMTSGYMWVLVGGAGKDPPYRFYQFYPDRKHIHAEEILNGYKGIIHSDKYGAYESYIRIHGNVWVPCWSHIRRKFFEAEMGDPALRTWVLEQIKQLFEIEETAWNLPPIERLQLRQTQAVPIIDEMIKRVKHRLTHGIILPKSKFKAALGYFCSLIPHVKNYTQHASARLDNNPAERAIRPLAIGRKNWLFLGSEESGKATATLLSLVQTCRALNINPRMYLEDVFRRIMGHSSRRVYELLPDEWLKSQI